MRHHPYFERAAHVIAAVALALGLLAAVPVLDALSRGGDDAPRRAKRGDLAGCIPTLHAEEGELVARVTVPRLSVDAPVYEGIQSRTLASGAGHLPGTPLPGEDGRSNNSVIAIPRDLAPTALAELAIGDGVQMRTRFGLKRYRVTQRRVVAPERVRLGPSSTPRVTFVTAYPVDSIGPAPLRLALVLEPARPEDAVLPAAPRPVRPRTALLRRPARIQRVMRPPASQISSALRNSETRPTGRTETSAYSDASEALPAGR